MLPPAVREGKCPAAAGLRAFRRSFQDAFPSTPSAKGGGCLEHLPLPCCTLHIIASVASERSSKGVWRQRQIFPEGIWPPRGRCWIIKGCHRAAQVPRNPVPKFPLLYLDQRGFQPRCLQGALSPEEPGAPAPATLYCDLAGGRAPQRGRQKLHKRGKSMGSRARLLETGIRCGTLTPLPPCPHP